VNARGILNARVIEVGGLVLVAQRWASRLGSSVAFVNFAEEILEHSVRVFSYA
jgi:hypothetical protein